MSCEQKNFAIEIRISMIAML